jgi:hypothetical protein
VRRLLWALARQPVRLVAVVAASSCTQCFFSDTTSVGGSCVTDAACDTGLCVRQALTATTQAWLGGYCSRSCSQTNACPTGSSCLMFEDGSSLCVASCSAESDCRTGYACASGACLPDCRLGWSCGTQMQCDQGSGACVYAQGPIGAACTLNAQCTSGVCTPETGSSGSTGWTGGYCTQSCDGGVACPAGSTCVLYADGSAYCGASCSPPGSCRAGYVCSTSVGACLPDCREGWSCGPTLVCQETGMCG